MKVWAEFGSEHSMNLVMIGSFREVEVASAAYRTIERLVGQVDDDVSAGLVDIGSHTEEFTDGMMQAFREVSVHNIGPMELQQFGYDVCVELKDKNVVLTTDESDVSAFLKVLLDKGARVELYSAHDYPEPEKP